MTPAQLAGQRIVYAFPGTVPPPSLVARIRRGEAGAVILFASNAPTNAAARALVARLQAIPRPAALNRPLLVMVDQEGGPVRRLRGSPVQSGAQLGAAGPAVARAAGRAAGRLLRSVGANVDLAPVADVGRPGSALVGEGRIAGHHAGAGVADHRRLLDRARPGGRGGGAQALPRLRRGDRQHGRRPRRASRCRRPSCGASTCAPSRP